MKHFMHSQITVQIFNNPNKMSTTCSDLESWVEIMMRKRDMSNYKMDISGSTSKGDGYLGEVNFIKVFVDLDNGTEKVYNLVVKSANKSEEFRKKTPIQEAYYREMFLYTKVFPMFDEFQKEYALKNPFEQYPKCYSTCQDDKKEALILKNLKTLGYDVHDRYVPQNLEHVTFVFKNYGKFHGTSLAMKTKKPAMYKSLTKNMTNIIAAFIVQADMTASFVRDFEKAREMLERMGKTAAARKFEGFVEELPEILTGMSYSDRPESVILHGDCWNNNMMFKYEGTDKSQPVGMCFIDFQLSRVASPIFDLSYYLYSVADRSILDNFDYLLQTYHQSLSDHLKSFNIDANDIVSLEDLKSQWRTFGKFGMAMTPFILKLELCQSDEVVDFAGSAEKGELSDVFDVEIKNKDEFEKRLSIVMEHFAENFM